MVVCNQSSLRKQKEKEPVTSVAQNVYRRLLHCCFADCLLYKEKKKGGELFTQCKALINVHAVCSSALSWYTDGKQNEKKKKKFALSKKCVCSCVSLRTQSPVLSVGCCGKVGGKQGLPVTCLRICGFVVRTLGALDLKGILNKTTP